MIPLNRAACAPLELEHLADALRGDRSERRWSAAAAGELSGGLGCDRVLLTPSCTSALEVATLLSGAGPGDEVIVPSFAYAAVANAVLGVGATPVFADVDATTLQVTAETIEAVRSPRTVAVAVVHYGGRSCDMAGIGALCDAGGLFLIEDCAHALFARDRSGPVGTRGAVAAFSFHHTKNVSCGEGGALVVNAEDVWERARIVQRSGTDQAAFMEGRTLRYVWQERGTNALLAEPLAALLTAQLRHGPVIQEARRRAWSAYDRELAGWAGAVGGHLPDPVAAPAVNGWHSYAVVLPSEAVRDACIRHCRERGVTAAFHYQPLHSSPAGRRVDPRAECPVTDSVARRLVRLPLLSDMTAAEVDRVVEVVSSFLPA